MFVRTFLLFFFEIVSFSYRVVYLLSIFLGLTLNLDSLLSLTLKFSESLIQVVVLPPLSPFFTTCLSRLLRLMS